jgi:hypothetical protein
MVAPTELIAIRRNLWCAFRDSLRELVSTEEADEHYPLLFGSMETYITDLTHQVNGTTSATLDYLADVKIGLRDAIELMEIMQERYPRELAGWLPGKPATSTGIEIYEALHQIVYDLSMTVWCIEAEFPEHKLFFEQERACYDRVRRIWAEQDARERDRQTIN